ncbi:MAG: hypothetical protein A3A33_03300 [Candidatus Yanofskybacteria bacterium RIFCSPLOWO2_01_FULL_49_25]|uniref:Uncharacterized protein n=1 Tax=Candidatus Yanofskybacteria bacterium RIFCSPLOWO2_01_FULL_49_25 TaxID=1802701 RepID=A0A1F8GU13_9BACT|nr:MAG: hypothetical protein A3A33_03300 [Candidatus Yanofskybacteria bacterium RIFCSPLOWO2_01_FULL_49_25]
MGQEEMIAGTSSPMETRGMPVRREVVDMVEKLRNLQRGRPLSQKEIEAMQGAIKDPNAHYEQH